MKTAVELHCVNKVLKALTCHESMSSTEEIEVSHA